MRNNKKFIVACLLAMVFFGATPVYAKSQNPNQAICDELVRQMKQVSDAYYEYRDIVDPDADGPSPKLVAIQSQIEQIISVLYYDGYRIYGCEFSQLPIDVIHDIPDWQGPKPTGPHMMIY